jgi:hypothetical protein
VQLVLLRLERRIDGRADGRIRQAERNKTTAFIGLKKLRRVNENVSLSFHKVFSFMITRAKALFVYDSSKNKVTLALSCKLSCFTRVNLDLIICN